MTTSTGSVLTGTPAGGDATAGTETNTNTKQQAAPPTWYEGIGDPGAIAWAKGRGYKLDDPTEAAKHALMGHYNAEKLIGLDRAGRTVAIPKEDAPAEEWDAYYGKLGRPANATEYKLPDSMKDDPVAASFIEMAHKAGYSQKQLDPVFEFVAKQTEAMAAQQEQAFAAQANADIESLRQEWGQSFELRAEAARRATRELGITKEQAESIEAALGVKTAAELFFKIGSGLMEDKPEGISSNGSAGGKFGISPSEAKGRIDALRRDQEFTARLLKGDASAKAEWDKLHNVAFG